MSVVSGPPGVWLIEMDQNFASIEKLSAPFNLPLADPRDAAPADLFPALAAPIAIYRPTLSFHPDQFIRALPKARFIEISIQRIRAGTDAEFVDLLRNRRRSLESMNSDLPSIAYQFVSGVPSGTYMFLTPLATLATLDDALARLGAALNDSPGDAIAKATAASGSLQVTHETGIFHIEPRCSYVSADFAAADPDFWNAGSAAR